MYWESKLDGQLEAQTRREIGVWDCLGAKNDAMVKVMTSFSILIKENSRYGEKDRKAVTEIFRSSSQGGGSI